MVGQFEAGKQKARYNSIKKLARNGVSRIKISRFTSIKKMPIYLQ